MDASSKVHVQPEKNRDPAEAGRDPEQLTAAGEHDASYQLYQNTDNLQMAGDRNNRVTEIEGNDHNTEPFNATQPNAYQAESAKGGQGIRSHPLRAELDGQKKLHDAMQPSAAPCHRLATQAVVSRL